MQNLLHARYYNIDENSSKRYLEQTQFQARYSGRKIPEVHCISTGLHSNIQKERQVINPMLVTKDKEMLPIKPGIGQEGAGMRCKIKTQTSKPIIQTIEKSPTEIAAPSISKTKDLAIPVAD